MTEKPFFSDHLIVTNASGDYYGFRITTQIVATEEYFQIGEARMSYDRIIRIYSIGSSLFVQYEDDKGKSCEKYLKYNTFLPTTAWKRLKKLVVFVLVRMRATPGHQKHRVARTLTTAQERSDGQPEITIHSSKISFPPFCPTCFDPALDIAKLEVSAVVPSMDLLQIGFWLVPVCGRHKKLTNQITVRNWSPSSTEIRFTFTNSSYSDAFRAINDRPIGDRNPKKIASTEILNRLKQFNYVIYAYYVSIVFFGFQGLSDIQQLRRNESRIVRGLKYSSISLTAGWWSFPFGPFCTISTLLKNFRGGIDVSERVSSVFEGIPFSASGE